MSKKIVSDSYEYWADIAGYENLYAVSNLGNVKSFRRCSTGYVMKPTLSSNGYLTVKLCKKGVHWRASVHRLVALAFLSNPDTFPQVNHIDKDRLNNTVYNLEWCTAQHNNDHCHSKWYEFLSPEGEITEIFNLNKFCRENSLNPSNMRSVLHGRYSHHKGWKAAEEFGIPEESLNQETTK